MYLSRNLEKWALENPLFPTHMSFIMGPRQSGKTSLVQHYLSVRSLNENYFNWDSEKVLKAYQEEPYFFEALNRSFDKDKPPLPIAFDEIHKRRFWKSYLKGAYDDFKTMFFFIVTGSGRLDLFQKGGDSLAGRYDPYFLHPLTPGEIEGQRPAKELSLNTLVQVEPVKESTLSQWENLGGFPEPFLSSSEEKSKAWWRQYKVRVVEEDVRSLSRIESIDLIRDLLLILPQRIGSPLSLNALRQDLSCSHRAITNYIKTLNTVFILFQVPPFSKKIHRAIKKEKKTYFYNFIAVPDKAARFENMIACLLTKWCSSANERALGNFELRYLKDQDGREVDFLITDDQAPKVLIEVKLKKTQFTSSSRFYSGKLKIPIIQIVREPNLLIKRENDLIASAHYLAALCG